MTQASRRALFKNAANHCLCHIAKSDKSKLHVNPFFPIFYMAK